MDTRADRERDMMYDLIEKELKEGKTFWVCSACDTIYKSKTMPAPCPNQSCRASFLLPYKGMK